MKNLYEIEGGKVYIGEKYYDSNLDRFDKGSFVGVSETPELVPEDCDLDEYKDNDSIERNPQHVSFLFDRNIIPKGTNMWYIGEDVRHMAIRFVFKSTNADKIAKNVCKIFDDIPKNKKMLPVAKFIVNFFDFFMNKYKGKIDENLYYSVILFPKVSTFGSSILEMNIDNGETIFAIPAMEIREFIEKDKYEIPKGAIVKKIDTKVITFAKMSFAPLNLVDPMYGSMLVNPTVNTILTPTGLTISYFDVGTESSLIKGNLMVSLSFVPRRGKSILFDDVPEAEKFYKMCSYFNKNDQAEPNSIAPDYEFEFELSKIEINITPGRVKSICQYLNDKVLSVNYTKNEEFLWCDIGYDILGRLRLDSSVKDEVFVHETGGSKITSMVYEIKEDNPVIATWKIVQ